tara:strand:- start:50 stop:598 length:549 start_codon:yes stop_codon:yes gene_type:complete
VEQSACFHPIGVVPVRRNLGRIRWSPLFSAPVDQIDINLHNYWCDWVLCIFTLRNKMPVKTTIDVENQLTIVEYVNPWSLEDLYSSFSERVTLHRLADLRRAGPLDWVDIDVLRKIAKFSQQFDTQRQPGGQTAFLVTEPYAQPLIRLFQALNEGEQDRSIEIQVFSDHGDAMRWLHAATTN